MIKAHLALLGLPARRDPREIKAVLELRVLLVPQVRKDLQESLELQDHKAIKDHLVLLE